MSNIKQAIELLNKRDISDMNLVYQDEFLNNLNHEQRVASTRKEGNYLVIAGPGSGKTHTLAYRVVYLVKHHVDPKSIVVITFTRKAGRELKERINHLLPNTSLGFVGTFHAFSHYISTKLGNSSPISGFRLLDQEDDVQVHKLVMADFETFKKNIKPKRVQKVISYCYNAELSISDYIKKFDIRDLKDDADGLERYVDVYEKYKAAHLLANYDDMIRLVSKYLKKEGSKKVTSDFDYLMVDEYQDTNQMQLDFIKRLKIDNVMAIGDDFQGIYAFRGADHRIILNFFNDFKQAQMIKLKDNYRSTSQIVDYVNKTVERSSLGYHKKFRVIKTDKGSAQVVAGRSLDEHKNFILGHIKENPKESHALIYRYNKNRTVFEKALIEENIDYSVYGGIRLLERKHIKDVMAFLMVNLNRLDVVSFNRILNLLPGIGPKTARKLIDSHLEDFSFIANKKRVLLEEVKNIINFSGKKETLYSKICEFYFKIYENVESDVYTKDEVRDDFKLVYDLLVTYDSLNNFVINLILDPVVDMHKGKRPKVILTTIHSAKGLEFDHVYYFHTHDWYKNYDLETLEEDRRLFYVGISRAKKNLYVFDHTGYSRSFDEIIRDFDNASTQPVQRQNFESKPKEEQVEVFENQTQVVTENQSNSESIDLESVYEYIEGIVYQTPTLEMVHQQTLMKLSGELYMRLKDQPYHVMMQPMKLKLYKSDGSEHIVRPDIFIGSSPDEAQVVIEIISEETRSKDMVQKMSIYMLTGIKEYWVIDTSANMVMVHTFKDLKLEQTKVVVHEQNIESHVLNISIPLRDILWFTEGE